MRKKISNKNYVDSYSKDDIEIGKNVYVGPGAVLRGDEVIIPKSNFVFKKQDIVVLLAKKDFLHVVENMFRISSI